MKKLIAIIAAVSAFAAAAQAQDTQEATAQAAEALTQAEDVPIATPKPRYWTNSLQTNITFGQTALVNWAAGGYNTITLAGNVDATANYAKDKMIWNNRLQLDYGFLWSADKPIVQKNKDRIYLESKWGYETPVRHLSWSANMDFRTQFDRNYTYGTPAGENPSEKDWLDARSLTSDILSPAYISIGLGILWTPKSWFSLNVSPITGGIVTVLNDEKVGETEHYLRSKYGMDPILDDEGNITGYQASRWELGAQIKADAKWTINDNFSYTTQLVIFYDYLGLSKEREQYEPRINWDNKVFWKIAKYFALTLSTNLIYDPLVKIYKTDKYGIPVLDEGGNQILLNAGQKNEGKGVQFRENFEFGFTWTIASKK